MKLIIIKKTREKNLCTLIFINNPSDTFHSQFLYIFKVKSP